MSKQQQAAIDRIREEDAAAQVEWERRAHADWERRQEGAAESGEG